MRKIEISVYCKNCSEGYRQKVSVSDDLLKDTYALGFFLKSVIEAGIKKLDICPGCERILNNKKPEGAH